MKIAEGLRKTTMPLDKKGRIRSNAVELENWQTPPLDVEQAHDLIRDKQKWLIGGMALQLTTLQAISNYDSDRLGLERVPVKAFNSMFLTAALIIGYANKKKRDFVGVNKHFMRFRKTMADSVVHERRHNWQHAILDGELTDHGLSEKEIKRMRKNRGIYNGKPREVDARDHARSYMREHNLGTSLVTVTNDLLSPITTLKRAVKESREKRGSN